MRVHVRVCVCMNEFEFQRLHKVHWTSECMLKFAVRFTNCTRMSAEPGRKAPYSNDIRWHVVWQRVGMELQFRNIAKNLCLSLGTVHNHVKRLEETGDISPVALPKRNDIKAYQELVLVGLLLDNPALYLSEALKIHAPL